ncbi:M16 family metallopeptidase [Rhodopirellula sp. MGV]|uniref:M16 family metallopeptidase n=1 Tax=Rhodopirellula sp. MGV TaxID=2023130 RepID=UPI000B960252|nr:pitrilysin family protein [Rhodopirellula sp. MGV]OYP35240.1 pseudouridine synthase [Rhodopirellula sp. MGV]PNY35666.1 insulinase family protein [Rhodopirellula baltica]
MIAHPVWGQSEDTTPAKPVAKSDAATPALMKITEIEGISEYKLDNGVRVLLFPDDSKEVVTVNMTVFVGSRHEGYGEAGMAHLLEHMLFKGTPDNPNVPKVLQDRGARFNGTTWVDRTNYYETLPASDENLEFALKLEADRLLNSFIRGEDLESEMTVVRNEFERGENSPFRILMQRMQSVAFDWHNYGKSTIGNRSDIERVPVVNLRQFYRKYYRPDNIMVIVAGKFNPETATTMIGEIFGSLESPDTPIDPTYTTEPAQDGERTVVLRRVGDVQLVGTTYHIPSGSHPEFAAAKALSIVLGDEPSGRLYQGLVESEMASNVFALAYAFADPGVLMTLTEVPEDKSIEDARAKLISILEDELTQTPITEQEVERAKQQILKQRELEAGETDRLAISLSEWAAQGDWRLYFLFRDVVESLTAEQVQQFAKRYLVRNNRTVGLFIPTETSERITIPESPNLIARLEDYKGREAIQQGEQFDPSPANIESRTERGKLDNGIEFALLPKQTRGGSVNLSLTLRFGTADAMINRLGAIELMGIMMTRGTEKLDYQAFQDELTRLRAELSINTVPGLLKVSLKTKREYLPEVIELLGQVLRSPRLDGSELEVLRRQIVTNLRQGSTMPESIAPRDVRRRLSPYGTDDIRYVQTVQEEIAMYENVSIDEINKAYQDLVGGNRGELAVVGDFDSSEIREQITTILGDWSSDIEYVRIDRPANDNIEGGLTEFNTPDKANAFYFSQSQMQLEDSSDEYAALVLGNYILGGGGLSSRLADRVRQQEGLSYGVRSGLTSRPKDNRVDFTIYAITNPENKDRLIEVIREEVERLRKDGVTAEELEKAQQAYLQSQVVRRTDDANLVGELLETMFMERTMEHAAKHAEQIKAATVDSVNAAIVKYIHWDRLVRSVAGEFEKAAE